LAPVPHVVHEFWNAATALSFAANTWDETAEKCVTPDASTIRNSGYGMEVTVTFGEVAVGTELEVHAGGYSGLDSVEACTRWQESLEQLANNSQPEIVD
jgi:hypothetical protein